MAQPDAAHYHLNNSVRGLERAPMMIVGKRA